MHDSIVSTTRAKRRDQIAIVSDGIEDSKRRTLPSAITTATAARQTLVRNSERAAHFVDCARNEQSAEDRIWGSGYQRHTGVWWPENIFRGRALIAALKLGSIRFYSIFCGPRRRHHQARPEKSVSDFSRPFFMPIYRSCRT
jgi:hypothetical protein